MEGKEFAVAVIAAQLGDIHEQLFGHGIQVHINEGSNVFHDVGIVDDVDRIGGIVCDEVAVGGVELLCDGIRLFGINAIGVGYTLGNVEEDTAVSGGVTGGFPICPAGVQCVLGVVNDIIEVLGLVVQPPCIVVGGDDNDGVGSGLCVFNGDFAGLVEGDKFADIVDGVVCVTAAVDGAAFYHEEEAVFIAVVKGGNGCLHQLGERGGVCLTIDIEVGIGELAPKSVTCLDAVELGFVVDDGIAQTVQVLVGEPGQVGVVTVGCAQHHVNVLIDDLFGHGDGIVTGNVMGGEACGGGIGPFVCNDDARILTQVLTGLQNVCMGLGLRVDADVFIGGLVARGQRSACGCGVGELIVGVIGDFRTHQIVLEVHTVGGDGGGIGEIFLVEAAVALYGIRQIEGGHAAAVGDHIDDVFDLGCIFCMDGNCEQSCGQRQCHHRTQQQR